MSDTRLIEVAFPLKQASLDSVHEKNVRHGHISTMHIWPARRPLAACRAALIATLLPDPGNKEDRDKLLDKLGGKVVKVTKKKALPSGKVENKEIEETIGGILHWGRESAPDLAFFKQKIREAYGGRAPKVLDPFAGGGAIPLEAMRLGCETVAADINPVAWFILKCTLEYPQKLAGQHHPLPDFALNSSEFMMTFFKETGRRTKKQLERDLAAVQQQLFPAPDLDLAWHVRAWGWWVFQKAKEKLITYYPIIDDKPTVAYLWARTVACKNCRATIPLLKTRWLCRKVSKRVLLTMVPNAGKTGMIFGIRDSVPVGKGNAAQRREDDKRLGAGTMSRTGAQCPCCQAFMTMEDVRQEGLAGRLGMIMTAVIVDGDKGKEYRLPVAAELSASEAALLELDQVFSKLPFGKPDELLPSKEALGFRVPLYGFDRWAKLFSDRQLYALSCIALATISVRDELAKQNYSEEFRQAIAAELALVPSKLADYLSSLCTWHITGEKMSHVFVRFALPITWDFAELNPISDSTGNYGAQLDWIARNIDQGIQCLKGVPSPTIIQGSAIHGCDSDDKIDLVITDPPYYDAIPYSDLMDFFYVWLRRIVYGLSPDCARSFQEPLGPKWNHSTCDGELIDDSSRFGGDKKASKKAYEDGMYRAFTATHRMLRSEGRLVVVFANKNPDAWEALVSAIIRAGFVVDGSWPIQTEMGNRTRAQASAALSSSVWLICKKRLDSARPGWDATVLSQMQANITVRLREFWDAGIRGPDFVWAATGPALEAYSQHPVVKKANTPGELLDVGEFLRAVRRMVVDFVVGRVLTHGSGEGAVGGLDDVTTYYLLHRNDFKMADAPVGPCILYAISCGLSDAELVNTHEVLMRTGGTAPPDEGEEDIEETEEPEEGTGSTVRLRPWNLRRRPSMGYDPSTDSARARRIQMEPALFPELSPQAPKAKPVPMIDMIHRLMHLWKTGDVVEVDEYLNLRGLRRNALFQQVLQALIELSEGEERTILESLSNHLQTRGQVVPEKPVLPMREPDQE